MLLCTAVYSLTREFYYSVLALSFAMCLAAFLVHWRSLPSAEVWKAGVLVVILTSSKAFMDFSSSGLENCLGALWACLFVAVWLNRRAPSTIRWAILIAASAYVTRQDTVLLYAPACAWLIVERRRDSPRWKRDVIVGLSPAIAWTVFSLVYFGFPFPNTAYGKALVAIPLDRRVEQGLRYFSSMAEWDIGGTIVIALAVAVSIWRRDAVVLMVGVVLHAVYVLLVAASSSPMALRFFSISVVLSAVILLRTLKRWEVGALALTATVISVASPISPWRSVGCAWAFLNPTTSLYVLDTRAVVCRDGGALQPRATRLASCRARVQSFF